MEISVQKRISDSDHPAGKKVCTDQKAEHSVTATKPPKGASEEAVGITQFIGESPGFYGTLKERYSDFIVNEIDQSGKVVRLTSFEKPEEPSMEVINLDENIVQKVQDLLNDENVNDVKIEVTDKDKESRKAIHVALRHSFKGIESTTLDIDNKKFIVVEKAKSSTTGRRTNPTPGMNYVHFVMYKENTDTTDAISSISKCLRVNPKIFSYCGTKDKRAKTCQMVSAFKLHPAKLLGVNKQLKLIQVGNVTYAKEQLKLGDLSGNLFVIVMRQLEGSPQTIANAAKELSENGFINYFGLQRFGTSCVTTHSIGRNFLLGNFKEVTDLILKIKETDRPDLAEAKKIWQETGDAVRAGKLLRNCSVEKKLFEGLASHNSNDLVNALNVVPRNVRLMYIHSYQSYIWNLVVSRRIKTHGLKVLVGDLIEKPTKEEADVKDADRKTMLANMVQFVTEADIHKTLITDVVLPLPGHSILLPKNETSQWYSEFLKEDGMSWSSFDSKIKAYSLSGAYRKMIVVPEDVKWELLTHEDPTEQLTFSDFEILQGRTPLQMNEGGSRKALKIEFKLPSASYATMAIRQMFKCSTQPVRTVQPAISTEVLNL